jgi:hypothetical protein
MGQIIRNHQVRHHSTGIVKAIDRARPNRYPSTPGVSGVKRVVEPPKYKPVVGPNVLFTGGIGDFFAIESFMTNAQRNAIKHVFLATRAQKAIQSILEASPIFPKLQRVTVLHHDWSKIFCVVSYEHLRSLSKSEKWNIDFSIVPNDLIDNSIYYVFNEITSGKRVYNPSAIFDHCFADISRFNLPETYTFIQPYSPNDRQGGRRDFTDEDWKITLKKLESAEKKGVVVVNSDDEVPTSPYLINLSNQTSVIEAIEIAKKCDSFIGVDSCFAGLVSKFLPASSMIIKTVNQHYLNYLKVYCSPHTTFDFVHSNIV